VNAPPTPPTDILARLAEAGIGIHLLPGIESHFLLARDRYAVLVRSIPGGFGPRGSAGLATEQGMAALVWEGDTAYFVAKGRRWEASPGEVEGLRRFSADVAGALGEKPISG
jgi:hypothetical protein